MFGFLNIYKPKGKTSHDVVAILRRITKIKQIGHTGTLDPFAEGVLPVCIGKATRLIEYLNDDKEYIGTVQLGKSTTTYDIDGDEVNISDKVVTQNDIEKALDNFRGEINQLPPIYSAIKVNGKKLYEYARESGGQGVSVDIKSRKVVIKELKILNFNPETRCLELFVSCSKGTYIRSIANDLGEVLGTYGYLIKLIRVKAGDFTIKNSVRLENLENVEQVKRNLILPLSDFPVNYLKYPRYILSELETEKIKHGMPITPKTDLPKGVVLLIENEGLVAVGEYNTNEILCKKVFL